jgi:hypothetical protein
MQNPLAILEVFEEQSSKSIDTRENTSTRTVIVVNEGRCAVV